ncbi:LLM class flavin-dependent oxidoreductase [Allokutzneria sp. A3M-2-11 16]|uniref:LLM class flavin-dependent oxidoreductase n=1 Tax=Allokutzneria sp. A3M-2-11 16 TaxID=2962043 RepID=UPI0020B8F94C|nr:LLM class flavin-dependent oxidoreductase [Allokutzneria sp. A3M-2-11 16]MCP3801930.1 LLM class flavin-dependent oxidoreductase [Allokutzneria sp. A3M-2-11 16]
MRFGVVILPEHHWPQARELWQRAEDLGFDHAWTYDHLRWRWLSDKPWFGTIPTLTAAATVTSRIRLGTLVANIRLRDPVMFAKEIMTVDDISGGRMICGVGSGGPDRDVLLHDELTRAQWANRYAEFVELTDSLLSQRPTAFEGSYYRCHDLVLQPGCVQRPRVPLGVAAAGPRGMRLAARFADTWITMGAPNLFDAAPYADSVPLVEEQVSALERACHEVGRDPSTIDRLLVAGPSISGVLDSVGAFQDAAGLFEEAGITDFVVHWPRPEFPYQGDPEVLADIAGSLPNASRRG